MYRTALRSVTRAAALRQSLRPSVSRRFASTAPADKTRSWRGAAVRWGLAIGAVYWYNTSPVFAEEPAQSTVAAPPQFSDSDATTVDAVIEEKRRAADAKARAAAAATLPPPSDPTSKEAETASPATAAGAAVPAGEAAELESLEEEASQEAAFNPETGEINWDCPCLGGMAHGPCGEEFKTAFSCFVHSTEEPKGMDCIDKFQHMQDCFRQYPDVYGAELAEDEEAERAESPEAAGAPATTHAQDSNNETPGATAPSGATSSHPTDTESAADAPESSPAKACEAVPDRFTPKSAFDTTSENEGK